MLTIAHVTHEAVHKIGGIGTVLEGLITAEPYRRRVERTVIVGPLFSRHGSAEDRLGKEGQLLYSSLDGRTHHPLGGSFDAIQRRFGVDIVYGRRCLRQPGGHESAVPEVLLIDVTRAHKNEVDGLKSRLFASFGVTSDRFENVWEYEQYIRLAGPAVAALRAMGVADGANNCLVVAHEFMGMPTALAAMLEHGASFRTVFHAHETAAVRKIVEEHEGHDTVFYNVMQQARREGKYLEDVFGSQAGYFKHGLVAAARHCDNVLAVGPFVVDELRFLSREFDRTEISLAYNGIPSHDFSVEEAAASKRKLQRYCEALLGESPDYVFTHVTRLVLSKGLWRDLWVLAAVERILRRENKTAVLLVLSTEIGGPRKREDILHMERWWNWPVAHREGLPDLSGGEAVYYAGVQEFNARSRHCKVVFINQFGFDREHCGERMPADIEFWDIRRGSDVEFGQSIYEPYGIAQLEALSYGALCVISNVCGCVGLVNEAAGGQPAPNVIVADYTALPTPLAVPDLLAMSREQRDRLAAPVAAAIGDEMARRLPRSAEAKADLLRSGHALSAPMSWDAVVEKYFLPAIDKALARRRG